MGADIDGRARALAALLPIPGVPQDGWAFVRDGDGPRYVPDLDDAPTATALLAALVHRVGVGPASGSAWVVLHRCDGAPAAHRWRLWLGLTDHVGVAEGPSLGSAAAGAWLWLLRECPAIDPAPVAPYPPDRV